MTSLFQSLSAGIARFVLGWIVPSAVTVGLFVLIVGRELPEKWPWLKGRIPGSGNGLIAVGVYTLAVLVISMFFAYSSLWIYRFLEGYTLPKGVARWCERRQLREWHRLKLLSRRRPANQRVLLAIEQLNGYPERREWLLPTRLGNELKALETYGTTHFHFDSQTLWYELQSVIPPQLHRDVEDGRAAVDFFVSWVAHLTLLSVVSAICAFWVGVPAWVLAVIAAVLIRPAYLAAVRNMGDWHKSVQATVNVGRGPLARSLGLNLPGTFQEELELWSNVSEFTLRERQEHHLRHMNVHRRTTG